MASSNLALPGYGKTVDDRNRLKDDEKFPIAIFDEEYE